MLLAGGQGSRLGMLTHNVAKPAVAFGGKYRIIDFPLSNCINSGVDTVGVLTQYRPLVLNSHIGIGIPWDLDRTYGGVTVLPPYEDGDDAQWYSGTANAVFQNIEYMERYNPQYVAILSGDHIYKMDYGSMLDFHKAHGADLTIATMKVPMEEASRFGIVVADEAMKITGFQEKPQYPASDLASMGIYIFSWSLLKEALCKLKDQKGLDFGKHVIPYCHEHGKKLVAYPFKGYWKDVGTLGSYWEANMELVDLLPEFNLYEEFWKTYTNSKYALPHYIGKEASVETSIISEGAEIEGEIIHSVIGPGVRVGKGSVIKDSIIFEDAIIGPNTYIEKGIVGERAILREGVTLGVGMEAPNVENKEIYSYALAIVGDNSDIPKGVQIGKNAAVVGVFAEGEIPQNCVQSGGYLTKAGGKE